MGRTIAIAFTTLIASYLPAALGRPGQPGRTLDLTALRYYHSKAFLDSLTSKKQIALRNIRQTYLERVAKSNEIGPTKREVHLRQVDDLAKRIFAALDPAEDESLRRFTLRACGPRALACSDAATRFSLSKDQHKRIQSIVSDLTARSNAIRMQVVRQASNEFTHNLKSKGFKDEYFNEHEIALRSNLKRIEPDVEAIEKRIDVEVLAVLNAGQRKEWKAQTSATGWRVK